MKYLKEIKGVQRPTAGKEAVCCRYMREMSSHLRKELGVVPLACSRNSKQL